MEYKIISADGHMDLFYLPPATFTSRVPARLKDKVPRVVEIDGKPWWVGDGAIVGGYQAWMGRGTATKSETSYRANRMLEAGWEPVGLVFALRQCMIARPVPLPFTARGSLSKRA